MPDNAQLTDEAREVRCAEALELMTEFLEEALGELDRFLFDNHLEGCEGCRIHLSQLKITIELIEKAGRLRL